MHVQELGLEDAAALEGRTVLVPRDNVVFEAGMSVGGLGLARTVFVCPTDDRLHLPTDLDGVTQLRYTPLPQADLGDGALLDQARGLVTDIQGRLNQGRARRDAGRRAERTGRVQKARPDPVRRT